MVKFSSILLAAIALLTTQSYAVSADAFSDDVLELHRKVRAAYGADPLTWDDALYAKARERANTCRRFGHGPGQNVFSAVNSKFGNKDKAIRGAMKAWLEESRYYNFKHGVFSPKAERFTQLVWKGTTHVGCAIANCGPTPNMVHLFVVVCDYSPPGNIRGEYVGNVDPPLHSLAGILFYS
ncbi:hypothetical protein BGZ76_009043 [Entomortierella beljakovae]|nr:hypothetical protein BGZ76_009043 [Entomortierella beljakovae]